MGFEKEYEKICPYCKKNFTATHLSQVYCPEKCKSRMFRKRMQEKRKLANKESDVFQKNNALLKSLIDKGTSKITKKELIKLGFNEDYYLKKIMYNNNLLTLLEDYYLEALSDVELLIHKN